MELLHNVCDLNKDCYYQWQKVQHLPAAPLCDRCKFLFPSLFQSTVFTIRFTINNIERSKHKLEKKATNYKIQEKKQLETKATHAIMTPNSNKRESTSIKFDLGCKLIPLPSRFLATTALISSSKPLHQIAIRYTGRRNTNVVQISKCLDQKCHTTPQ